MSAAQSLPLEVKTRSAPLAARLSMSPTSRTTAAGALPPPGLLLLHPLLLLLPAAVLLRPPRPGVITTIPASSPVAEEEEEEEADKGGEQTTLPDSVHSVKCWVLPLTPLLRWLLGPPRALLLGMLLLNAPLGVSTASRRHSRLPATHTTSGSTGAAAPAAAAAAATAEPAE